MATISELIRDQAETLIIEAIKAQDPSIDLRPGTPQYDLYINPFLQVVAEIVERLVAAETKRTPLNFDEMSDEEMDAYGQRYFIERIDGTQARGTVRLKFLQATRLVLSTASNLTTADGLVFNPVNDVDIPAAFMQLDPSTRQYTADVPVIAAATGPEYRLSVGATLAVEGYTGTTGFVECIVRAPFTDGVAREGNESYYNRIIKSLTVRNLINPISTETVLLENFAGTIERMRVIGFQEPEMRRDLVTTIDPTLGPITFHRGNHTDIFVKTPLKRELVTYDLAAGQQIIDLTGKAPVLKVHSVSVEGDPTANPFWVLVENSVETRYSAIDGTKIFIDPAVSNRRIVVDMTWAPDVKVVHDFVNDPLRRLTLANLIVRYFHPVWVSANIYVEGGADKETAMATAVQGYLDTLTGTDDLVVSRLTDALHTAGATLVHQDYDITTEVTYGDGERSEKTDALRIRLDERTDKGFSRRVATFINEGIIITPLS